MADDVVIHGVDGHDYQIPADSLPKPAGAAAKKGNFVFGMLTIRTEDGVIEIPMDQAAKYRRK